MTWLMLVNCHVKLCVCQNALCCQNPLIWSLDHLVRHGQLSHGLFSLLASKSTFKNCMANCSQPATWSSKSIGILMCRYNQCFLHCMRPYGMERETLFLSFIFLALSFKSPFYSCGQAGCFTLLSFSCLAGSFSSSSTCCKKRDSPFSLILYNPRRPSFTQFAWCEVARDFILHSSYPIRLSHTIPH